MQRVRQHFVRFTLLLGVVAWVVGSSVSLAHQTFTIHVACADHGDMVEVGHAKAVASADVAHGPVAKAFDTSVHHEHDCAFHALGVAGIPKTTGAVASVLRVVHADDPVPDNLAPRGPPLHYAPKTSPPRIA